jgi:hypothetical protein
MFGTSAGNGHVLKLPESDETQEDAIISFDNFTSLVQKFNPILRQKVKRRPDSEQLELSQNSAFSLKQFLEIHKLVGTADADLTPKILCRAPH